MTALLRALCPSPRQSALLLIIWLLLNNSMAPGQILLGLGFAMLLPIWWRRFWPRSAELRRPGVLARLVLLVLKDIVVANFLVAAQILGPNSRLHPAFVELPLEIGDDVAITLLASIVSLTPGTVSASVSGDRRTLLIHALNCTDPAQLITEIKQRYEAPIKEAFGC